MKSLINKAFSRIYDQTLEIETQRKFYPSPKIQAHFLCSSFYRIQPVLTLKLVSLFNKQGNSKIVSQKQSSRGALRKRCSDNMYKFTGEYPCLLKLHISMVVLLSISCIFSEHLSLRTPVKGYFWRSYLKKLVKFIGKQLSWKIFEYSCKPEFCIHMWTAASSLPKQKFLTLLGGSDFVAMSLIIPFIPTNSMSISEKP